MRRRRRLWIILLAAPFLLAAADALYWHIAERNLENGFASWLAGQQASGWVTTAGKPVRGGWPLAATLTVPEVSLKGGDADIPGGLTWSADRLELRVALLRPWLLDIAGEGMERLRLADGPEIPFTADHMHITMPLQTGGAAARSTEFAAKNLRAGMPMGNDATAGMTIGLLRLHLDFRQTAQSGEPALAFSLHAEEIGPPPGIARALGPRIADLTVKGALDGPVPHARALAERAAAWRDGGGTLEIQQLALNWGPLNLNASATLALDEQLQPMGAGNAHVVGYAETLDALAAHNVVSKSAATAAKAVLSLLAHSPDDGGPPDVDVPLTLQYRTLSMRQVPLVRLPELDWPGSGM
jgi:hypothetical protein